MLVFLFCLLAFCSVSYHTSCLSVIRLPVFGFLRYSVYLVAYLSLSLCHTYCLIVLNLLLCSLFNNISPQSSPESSSSTPPPSSTSLIADAVRRSTVGHLFNFYALFCEIGSVPRRTLEAWLHVRPAWRRSEMDLLAPKVNGHAPQLLPRMHPWSI